MIMQTIAIFRDAYRELNSKKLFWLVLLLSGIVVASFGAIGVNDRGLVVLVWTLDSPIFNTRLFPPDVFYKLLFANLGIGFWLAWLATILALVSTAGIFPDFISSGSIELVLSRPLGRLRLFLTKYLAGLLFVTLQVAVFTLASFLVIGIRGKAWEPGLFWAVPLTVCFFSYLFAICVLLGMLTRSTIASLLLTLLLWLAVFGIHTTETIFLWVKVHNQVKIATIEKLIPEVEAEKAASASTSNAPASPRDPGAAPLQQPAGAERSSSGSSAPAEPKRETQAKRSKERANNPYMTVERLREQLDSTRGNSGWIRRTHNVLFAAKTVLPKTSETIELLKRKLITAADLERMRDNSKQPPPVSFGADDVRVDEQEVQHRIEDIILTRSVGWVAGTSLVFELVIVGIAGFIFCRRDF